MNVHIYISMYIYTYVTPQTSAIKYIIISRINCIILLKTNR